MRFLKIIYPTVLVCCLAASPAFAGSFEEAQAAYNQQDYKTAFKLLQPLAEQGNADAQYKLGIMYDYGYGVRKSAVQAVDWFRRAAVQGNKAAERHYEADNFALNLGLPEVAQVKASDKVTPVVADTGKKISGKEAQHEPVAGNATPLQPPIPLTAVVPSAPDNQPAVDAATVQTLTRLAGQGVAEAQRDLGILYQLGNGVPQDYGQATIWFTKAAAQGDVEAQERLSGLYAGGLTQPQKETVIPKDQSSPAPAVNTPPPVKAEQAPPQQAETSKQQISLATQQGFDVGVQAFQYKYREQVPGADPFMNDWGKKMGVEAGYTEVLVDDWFLRGEGRIARGKVDYAASNGLEITDIPERTWEVRALEGKDFDLDTSDLSPYMGYGFRYFWDNNGAGSNGPAGGYIRTIKYQYIPLGLTERFRLGGQARLATNVEYDQFLRGTVFSGLSEAEPGWTNIVNRQSKGIGGRASVLFEMAGWSVGPYFNYWHIQESNTVCAVEGCGDEPDNRTTELGFKIVKNFW